MRLVDTGGSTGGGYRIPGAYRHALWYRVWGAMQPDLFIGEGDDDYSAYERAEAAAKIRTAAVVDQLAAAGDPVAVPSYGLPRELPQVPLFFPGAASGDLAIW